MVGVTALSALVAAFGYTLADGSQRDRAMNELYNSLSPAAAAWVNTRQIIDGYLIMTGVTDVIQEIGQKITEIFGNGDIPVEGSGTPIYNISDLVYTGAYMMDFTEADKTDAGRFSERYSIMVTQRYFKPAESPYGATIDYINSLPLTYVSIGSDHSFIIEDNGYVIEFGWNGAAYHIEFEGESTYFNATPSEIALGIVRTPDGPRLAVTWDNSILPFMSGYMYYNLHVVAPNIELSFEDGAVDDVIPVFNQPGKIPDADVPDIIGNFGTEAALQGMDIAIRVLNGELELDIPETQAETLENIDGVVLEGVETANPSIVGTVPIPVDSVLPENTVKDVQEYSSPGLKDVFPFCLPFDIANIVKAFEAARTAPEFDINWHIPIIEVDFAYHVDFSQFETLAQILRTGELICFCIGLVLVTSKLIKW